MYPTPAKNKGFPMAKAKPVVTMESLQVKGYSACDNSTTAQRVAIHWTYGAASRHTTTRISHTRSAFTIFHHGGMLHWPEHTVG